MTTAPGQMVQASALIRFLNPLTRTLLRLGVPMGPNVLLTMRGRKSGLPRSNAVAMVDFGGRRWLIGSYGDVHWTRNLRSAREATIRLRGSDAKVRAIELSVDIRSRFFSDTLVSYIRELPLFWRLVTKATPRLGAPEILDDPVRAAAGRPVFELGPQDALVRASLPEEVRSES